MPDILEEEEDYNEDYDENSFEADYDILKKRKGFGINSQVKLDKDKDLDDGEDSEESSSLKSQHSLSKNNILNAETEQDNTQTTKTELTPLQKELKKKWWLINPNSRIKIFWDYLLAAFIVRYKF